MISNSEILRTFLETNPAYKISDAVQQRVNHYCYRYQHYVFLSGILIFLVIPAYMILKSLSIRFQPTYHMSANVFSFFRP